MSLLEKRSDSQRDRDIYCRVCRYCLSGAAEERCPECGHAFSSADPLTFDTIDRIKRRRKVRVMRVIGVVCFASSLFLFARWGLKRGWESRSGSAICSVCGMMSTQSETQLFGRTIGGRRTSSAKVTSLSSFLGKEADGHEHRWEIYWLVRRNWDGATVFPADCKRLGIVSEVQRLRMSVDDLKALDESLRSFFHNHRNSKLVCRLNRSGLAEMIKEDVLNDDDEFVGAYRLSLLEQIGRKPSEMDLFMKLELWVDRGAIMRVMETVKASLPK